MKITREQLQALQENQPQRAANKSAAGEFGELLARHLEAGANGAAATASLLDASGLRQTVPVLADGISFASEVQAGEQGAGLVAEAAAAMEGIFGSLEQYAAQLSRDKGANLREADALLRDVDGQIAQFRSRFGAMAAEQPALSGLITEAEVLSTTERFKFNRGDYI
ncbi:hypothetical protein LJC59_10190 [Desulfovibrio sp. OttesenSCG-928-A18]|nr:hypothetical protein [Desulfovibrio sp. OttesenSCG-928-A18]